MIQREINLMIDSLDAHKIHKGITFETIVKLLSSVGYITKSDEQLAENIFYMMTGCVKPVHRQGAKQPTLAPVLPVS